MASIAKYLPQARRPHALQAARNLIEELGLYTLPIDPFDIIRRQGWKLLSRSEYARLVGRHIGDIPNEDGVTIPFIEGDRLTFAIVYSPQGRTRQRIRFTLAHEIGHIRCGHFDDFDIEWLLSKAKTGFAWALRTIHELETEANAFASELLMPMSVVTMLPNPSQGLIRKVFDVSAEASKNRLTDLRYWGRTKWRTREAEFQWYFRRSEDHVEYRRAIAEAIQTADHHLLGVPTNENGHFLLCPRCGLDDLGDDDYFCRWCGFPLYNTCGAPRGEDPQDCNKVNPGDARYCSACGDQTLLFKEGVLVDVLQHREDILRALEETPIEPDIEWGNREDWLATLDAPNDEDAPPEEANG